MDAVVEYPELTFVGLDNIRASDAVPSMNIIVVNLEGKHFLRECLASMGSSTTLEEAKILVDLGARA